MEVTPLLKHHGYRIRRIQSCSTCMYVEFLYEGEMRCHNARNKEDEYDVVLVETLGRCDLFEGRYE